MGEELSLTAQQLEAAREYDAAYKEYLTGMREWMRKNGLAIKPSCREAYRDSLSRTMRASNVCKALGIVLIDDSEDGSEWHWVHGSHVESTIDPEVLSHYEQDQFGDYPYFERMHIPYWDLAADEVPERLQHRRVYC